MRKRRALLALVAVAGLAAACVPPPPPPPPALTFPCTPPSGSPVAGNDPLRSGWYPDQPGLNPASGGQCGFGEQWSVPVNGQVYAAPLVDPGTNTLFVATETNTIYGLDPGTGVQKWTPRNLGQPWNPADVDPGCTDIVPSIGITSTPAIDAATQTAYLFSKTYDNGSAAWFAHAINLTTGAERPGFPVKIQGTAANDPSVTFDPKYHLQRPGLLLMNGVVYAAFGSHCAFPPYRGWVVGVSTAGSISTLWTNEALLVPPNASPGGGIWHAGGRLVSAQNGEILLASGNGVATTTPLPGSTPPTTLGESVIRLQVLPSGALQPVDFFTPCNAEQLSATNSDLGSGAPLVLPSNPFGSSPNLAVVAGKEGTVYLLDRDDLGGFQQGAAGTCPEGSGPPAGDNVESKLKVPNQPGPWGSPTVWPGEGGSVFVPHPSFPQFGLIGKLTAYRVVNSGGQPTLSVAGQSADNYGFGSSSAITTSSGMTPGSALVWVVYAPVQPGGVQNAELRAYDPTPVNNVLTLRGAWPLGTGTKFNTPTVHAGRIYVGVRDGMANGRIRVFGAGGQSSAQAPSSDGPDAGATAEKGPDRER